MKLSFAIITISDTRTAKTDESGQRLEDYVIQAGHSLAYRKFARDETEIITATVGSLIKDDTVDVILTTGGTGITKFIKYGHGEACSTKRSHEEGNYHLQP